MAVVAFQRLGDAVIAKMKYDGKFVDQSEYAEVLSTEQLPDYDLNITRNANQN